MKKTIAVVSILILISCTGISCKKENSGGGTTPPPSEENLRISTNAGSLNILPGSEFDLTLVVESKMPADGVKIEYTVRGESDNQNYPQGPAIETKASSNAIRLTGLPRQKFCVCTITVTSKSKATNVASTNFRVVYK